MTPREQQRTDELATLAATLERLAAINPNELVRADELGELNFRDAIPIFEHVLSLFTELRAADLSVFPLEVVHQMRVHAEEALTLFDGAQTFSLGAQSNPSDVRQSIVQGLDAAYGRFFLVLEPHVNYVRMRDTDLSSAGRRAEEVFAELDQFVGEQRASVEALRAEMESTLRTAKAAAVEAGVGQQSQVFKAEADKNDEESAKWLSTAIKFGLAALVYALAFFVLPDLIPLFEPLRLRGGSTEEILRSSLARLVVLSLLLFGLGFSARFYGASRHNGTVNRHRQNALQTFETFVRAADDAETKDAVLVETTRSIFGAQPSGFLRADRESEPSTVVEVVRRVTGTNS